MGAFRRDAAGVGILSAAAHTLATPRLTLRPCTPSDVDALHTLWSDAAVRRWLWDGAVIDRATAAEVVAASEASFAAHGYGQWCVDARDTPGLIGFAGLRDLEDESDVELLYGLLPSQWGRGFAHEAARAVLAHGFESARLERIVGRTDTPNRASARVLERLGMRFEDERLVGDLPTLHYSITRAV